MGEQWIFPGVTAVVIVAKPTRFRFTVGVNLRSSLGLVTNLIDSDGSSSCLLVETGIVLGVLGVSQIEIIA